MAKAINIVNRPLVQRVSRFAAVDRRSVTAEAEVLMKEAMDAREAAGAAGQGQQASADDGGRVGRKVDQVA